MTAPERDMAAEMADLRARLEVLEALLPAAVATNASRRAAAPDFKARTKGDALDAKLRAASHAGLLKPPTPRGEA